MSERRRRRSEWDRFKKRSATKEQRPVIMPMSRMGEKIIAEECKQRREIEKASWEKEREIRNACAPNGVLERHYPKVIFLNKNKGDKDDE